MFVIDFEVGPVCLVFGCNLGRRHGGRRQIWKGVRVGGGSKFVS